MGTSFVAGKNEVDARERGFILDVDYTGDLNPTAQTPDVNFLQTELNPKAEKLEWTAPFLCPGSSDSCDSKDSSDSDLLSQ